MRKYFIIAVCVLCLILSGCGGGNASTGDKQVDVTLGGLNGNLYTNDSLGVTMEIPEGWYALDEGQRMDLMQAGVEDMAGGDKIKQNQIELSLQKTLPLINAYEKNPLTTTAENPNVQLQAEKISLMDSVFIKSADDYITAVKTQLENVTNIGGVEIAYTFGEISDMTFGDKNFRILNTQLELADGTVIVLQKYYIYMGKDYCFAGIGTYFTQGQLDVIEASLSTLIIA